MIVKGSPLNVVPSGKIIFNNISMLQNQTVEVRKEYKEVRKENQCPNSLE